MKAYVLIPLVARITAQRLGALEMSGSSSVALHVVHDDRLTLDLSGSAVIRGDGAVASSTSTSRAAATSSSISWPPSVPA